MTRSLKQPDDWTPDQPHYHAGKEMFCRALVNKYTPGAAYGQHLTKSTNKSSLKAMGWKVAQEPAVVARLNFLRAEKQAELEGHDQELTGEVLARLMADVSAAFVTAHVRTILGAVSAFERHQTVGRLKAARDRRSAALGRRVEGRKPVDPETLALAKRLYRKSPKTGQRRSLSQIASALADAGCLGDNGTQYSDNGVKKMLIKVGVYKHECRAPHTTNRQTDKHEGIV
ncbi:MAG: hypothetical protein ACSHWQ_09760 [Spongiibacteraceae bacterium]